MRNRALCQAILDNAAPRLVNGTDRSPHFISQAQAQVQDARASFQVADARELPDATASYDAAVSALLLNHLPQPERAVREMTRVVKAGGHVAAYVWDYPDKMQFIRHFWNAAVALDRTASELDQGRRYPLCQPKPLAELFQSVGLRNVHVHAIDISTNFKDFEDYWSPFLGGQGPAPEYVMSLSEERRAALREGIRAKLPFAANGSIPLVARAWAVRGARP
jgi:SAM-dependent methyltransferase